MPLPTTTDHSTLLLHAQMALRMSQERFGALIGVSRRTIIRWETSRPRVSLQTKKTVVQAVHPVDAPLAAAIAKGFGETLESLGVLPPPSLAPALPPPPPGPIIAAPHLADSVVCAAAEAVGLAPQAIRPALLAAFERAASVGLSVDDVRKALVSIAGPHERPHESRGKKG
jgi:DNA-binding XRE family transcriptional regulator